MKASIKDDLADQLWGDIVRAAGGTESSLPRHPMLTALCAEPGTGCADVIACALRWAERLGARVLRRDLGASSQESATQFLTRLARRLSQAEGTFVVGIDALPPSDESHVVRQARALRKMHASGASVIVSIVPEGSQLFEELPECSVIGPSRLLVPLSAESRDAGEREMVRLTRSIPSLVRSLAGRLDATKGTLPGAPYVDALVDLLAGSVRPTLSDEECRVRLAMIFLGSGACDEAARVAGSARTDVFEGIRTSAPLFGVAPDLSAFACVSAFDVRALRACLRRLERACALHSDVLAAAMRALVARGDYERAAALGILTECPSVCEVVVERGAEFLDRGETDLVRRVLDSPACPRGEEAALLRGAVAALAGRPWDEVVVPGLSQGRGAARLLTDACGFLGGQAPLYDSSCAPMGELERALHAHAQACALMRDGRFTDALRLLAAEAGTRRPETVSGALLVVDGEMARIMTGGAPRDDAVPEGARELLSRRALRGLRGYLVMEQLAEAALGRGTGDEARAQALVSRAERSGMALVQATSLVVGSALDLREASVTRAHVRASLASSIATGVGADYLARAAGLLMGVSRYLMGGRLTLADNGRDDDLGTVCALVRSALEADAAAVSEEAVPDEVPWNALWLVAMLLSGRDELSDLVARRLPTPWRRALGEDETATGRALGRGEDERGVGVVPASREAPLRLTLLGGFSLSVRGTLVPDWKIERRNAKSLLEYLVLRHGSETKRFRLVEQVWPDCDYVRGFSRAYQATSVLRRAIAEIDPDLDPFVASRTSREISLDMGMVSCDVDEFRRVARAAVDGRDDERVLELSLRAERLYEGDLYLPTSDATGFIAGLREELRNLCADAMVAGAEAATRLGRERTAARLAREAVGIDDLREDAVVALVRALRACGRSVEADRQDEAFRSRVARASRRRGARRLVEGADVGGDPAEAAPGACGAKEGAPGEGA